MTSKPAWLELRLKDNLKKVTPLLVTSNHPTQSHALLEVDKPIEAWKRVYVDGRQVILKLKVPPGALMVVHAFDSKCRSNVVLTERFLSHVHRGRKGISLHDCDFEYEEDTLIVPTRRFGTSKRTISIACAIGIHFYLWDRDSTGRF